MDPPSSSAPSEGTLSVEVRSLTVFHPDEGSEPVAFRPDRAAAQLLVTDSGVSLPEDPGHLQSPAEVRYEWLTQVRARDRFGLDNPNMLELQLKDPGEDGRTVVVTVVLDRRTPATALAAELVARAASHRAGLATSRTRASLLTAYAENPSYTVPDGRTRCYRLLPLG